MKDVYSFEILKIVKCSLEHRVSSISFLLQLKFFSSLELVFILVFFLVNRILSWISPSLLSVEDDSLFWEFVDRLCSEKNTIQLISNKEMSSRILYLSINFFDRDSIFFQSLIRWNLWMHIDGLQPIAMGHSSWLVHNNAINWAKHEPTRPSKVILGQSHIRSSRQFQSSGSLYKVFLSLFTVDTILNTEYSFATNFYLS